MKKQIFRAIIKVALAVLLASLVLIVAVLHRHFQERVTDELGQSTSYIAHGVENEGMAYLMEGLPQEDRITWVAADGTVLFDNREQVVHDRVPMDRVAPLTEETYFVRGSTALLDALGGAIHHIGLVHKYARPEDVPARTLFVITTDGMENASHRYTADQVREMIHRQKERYGWEFLFLGANIDAVETAARYGIGADRAVNYHADEAGTQLNYRVVSRAVAALRREKALDSRWKEEIEADFHKRRCER